MKKFINIIIILSIAAFADAQVYQAYIDAAEQAYETKDFRSATSYYGEAMDMEQEVDTILLQKYAESAFYYKAYNKAHDAYLNLLSANNSELQLESLTKLASINFTLGNYEKSKEYLALYLDKSDANEARKSQATKTLSDINWALSFEEVGNFEVQRLDDNVNTEYSEMSPVNIDGVLHYSSNNYFKSNDVIKPQSKVFTHNEGKASQLASAMNKGDFHIGHYVKNSDASAIYFTRCLYELGEIKCKIFVQNISQDNEIKELPQNINSVGDHTSQPSIGVDPKTGKEVLYFASNRAGGAGGMDIYYSPIQNGIFEGPFPIAEVNTIGDEVSPFYHSASNQLYFSTDGRKTFGGLDIHSFSIEPTFNEVVNLGPSINSSYNEAYFTLSSDGKEAFFSSNRVGSKFIDAELEACCYDIYLASLDINSQSITTQLFDKETSLPLSGVKLDLSALPTIENQISYDPTAVAYELDLRDDLQYNILASKEGYEESEVEIYTKEANGEIKIYLSPTELKLTGFVVDELNQKLSDYTYTLSPENSEAKKTNKIADDNQISENITKNKGYTLKVEKDGFYPESIVLKQEELLAEDVLELDVILKKIPAAVLTKLTLDGYLPLPLFFDNDEPDRKTISTTTTKNYHQTFLSYYQRRGEYVSENAADLPQETKLNTEFEVNQFFDYKVKFGDESLESFTEHLLKFLQQGSQAEIMLRGYASPRFQTNYNDALTSRRVRSVENHFHQWKGGVLKTYIDSGQLKLTERPLGESQAPASVSDVLSDKKASIYSIEASKERRVEILEITSSNVSQ